MNDKLLKQFLSASLLTLSLNAMAASPIFLGTIKSSNCRDKKFKIWISQNPSGQLIFQADAPLNSTFEARLIPAFYKVVITSEAGCFAEAEIEVKASDKIINREFTVKGN